MAFRLPRFIVIRSNYYSSNGNFYYKEADGSVVLGEPSVFSTLVKIEVERATTGTSTSGSATSTGTGSGRKMASSSSAYPPKQEEDTSKPSCTLFEPIEVPNSNGTFYLTHVQSGGRLLIDDTEDDPTMSFYVNLDPESQQGYLTFVNWETLVKLPERVAFRGDNEKFLEGVVVNGNPLLRFSSDDPNARSSGHEVTLMPDGHVRIRSDRFGKFWRRSPNWIWADSSDTTAADKDTLFWPVKIDASTISLRNAGNNNFCKRLTAEHNDESLNAAVDTITTEARLRVQEQVLDRSIYNVRYRMRDARIFNETPFVAGSSILVNDREVASSLAVEIKYEVESSYKFSRSLSMTAGVTTTISFEVPFITGASIEVRYEINTTLEWENTTTTKMSVTATGSVPVPPMTSATISYVGTRGTCNIPFYYTQRDKSSTDGAIAETDRTDGIYTGVNCYGFQFVVEKAERLA